MLSDKAEKYAGGSLSAMQDEQGFYFPDTVVESLRNSTQSLQTHAQQDPIILLPRISPADSKKLIIDALNNFHPELGRKAQEIFDAGFDDAVRNNTIEDIKAPITPGASQWRIRSVDPGKTKIMRSVSAHSAASEYSPVNPNPQAVIQFEYDHTINSVIYLAHELGHAIADAYIRDPDGNKYGDNSLHLDEVQAYFVQHIMYDYLKKHPDPAIATAAKEHYAATMMKELHALATVDIAQAASREIENLHLRSVSLCAARTVATHALQQPMEERQRITDKVLGRDGPQNIVDILAATGSKSQAQLEQQFKTSLADIGVKAAPRNAPLQARTAKLAS